MVSPIEVKVINRYNYSCPLIIPAGVAELADALDLGSSGTSPLEVQILSPAPFRLSESSVATGQNPLPEGSDSFFPNHGDGGFGWYINKNS
jgi:hypothetical protein